MLWIFVTFLLFAATYFKLGAITVWASMITAALNVLFVVVLGLLAYIFWKKRGIAYDERKKLHDDYRL